MSSSALEIPVSNDNVSHARLTPVQFLVVLGELGLVLFAAYALHIEDRHDLHLILPVVFAGFAIHAWLPPGLRPMFFLALSAVCIWMILGPGDGSRLLAAGGLLFALCHLPGAWSIASLLVAGVVLALTRVEWIPVAFVQTFGIGVLPWLAAMFMFRIVIYLHDLRHETRQAPLSQRLCYFFMLPNICFPLFPVVDYRTFVREYYSAPALGLYQKGLRWIMRGIVHLVLYRLVYHYFTPSFEEVKDLKGVVEYVVSSYLLYLRVSGMFHIAVGMLCLFGYNLPETHRLYFLASSFTDFWRRINIYWKDFVMKILYYPLFMRLRKKVSMTQAVMIVSVAILICSWLLHSYQTFWLQGVFPIAVQDAVFWTLLGLAVAVNSALELRRGRARARAADTPTIGAALILAAKTTAMFCFMAMLWSFWSTNSVAEWLAVLRVAGNADAGEFLVLIAVMAGLVAFGTAVQLVLRRDWVLSSEKIPSFGRSASVTVVAAVAAIYLSSEPFGDRLTAGSLDVWVSLTSKNFANNREQELETRGYYEELLGAETPPRAVWTLQGAPLVKRYFSMVGVAGLADVVQGTDDVRRYELRPSVDLSYKGAAFHTNRWGMRDQDYPQHPPPGACRMLLFGDSHTMGSGVADEDTYEAVLEQRLNRERPNPGCQSYEILNLAVAGYSALQTAVHARLNIAKFAPDLVIYASAQPELEWTGQRLALALAEGVQLDDPFLLETVRSVGITPGMNEFEMRQRLAPAQETLVRWAYETIADTAAAQGAASLWVFLPRFDADPDDVDSLFRYLGTLARESGLTTVSVAGAYEGVPANSLLVAPWDKHPNARASALIADKLFEFFRENGGGLLSQPAVGARGDDDTTVPRRAPGESGLQATEDERHGSG